MSWEKNAQYWRSIPTTSNAMFLAGVFCTFGSFGFIAANVIYDRPNTLSTIVAVLIYGAFGAAWAFAGCRRLIWMMLILAPGQFVANLALGFVLGRVPQSAPADPAAFRRFAMQNCVGAIVLIIAGYVLFVLFVRKEATRYYSTTAEMRIAAEMHRIAVPEISRTVGRFETFGNSWPAGDVGGDLVDVVFDDRGWTAYVADVSGHGVSAGTFMAMVKSAARVHLAVAGPDTLLSGLNAALTPISASNMFVTIAYLSLRQDGMIVGTAAHLPVLKYSAATRTVEEHGGSNLPVAMLEHAAYSLTPIKSAPGDVFAILTDGFTEVRDRSERELGLEPLKDVLRENAEVPLRSLAGALRERAVAHGRQVDDQTVLLVRHAS